MVTFVISLQKYNHVKRVIFKKTSDIKITLNLLTAAQVAEWSKLFDQSASDFRVPATRICSSGTKTGHLVFPTVFQKTGLNAEQLLVFKTNQSKT